MSLVSWSGVKRPLLGQLLLVTLLLSLPLAGIAAEDSMPRVRISTNLGDIVLELDPLKAPASVQNFLTYVQDGAYDGTIFHRVIGGFMAQGGGYTQDFVQIPTHEPIVNEANNGLENVTGSIAMARTNDPNSATSQFFINVADNDFLNHRSQTPRGWGYAVFGQVIEGMNVVRKIERSATIQREVQPAAGQRAVVFRDVPRSPIVIQKAVLDNVSLPSMPAPDGNGLADN